MFYKDKKTPPAERKRMEGKDMFRKDNKRLRLQKEEERKVKAYFRKKRKDSAFRKKNNGRERLVLERQEKTPPAEKKDWKGKACFGKTRKDSQQNTPCPLQILT
jgi:hypothetical protein